MLGLDDAVTVALAVLGLVTELGSAEIVSVSNGGLRVGFDRHNGHWVELVDLASNVSFIASTGAPTGLWQMSFQSHAGPGGLLTPLQAGWCQVRATDPRTAELVWDKFGLEQAPELRVRVRVRLAEGQGASVWHLAIENGGDLDLGEIRFPQLEGIARRDGERLAVPVWMGQVATSPRSLLEGSGGKGRELEFDYPGHTSMQCVAWYEEGGPGFYLSCDDTNAFLKRFAFEGMAGGRVDGRVEHLVEKSLVARAAYELPYRVVVGTFRGDWFSAAEVYRAWATNQCWVRESRRRRGLVAPWVVGTGLWVWNRGRSSDVIGPARFLRRESGLPVSVFWHWWHGCAYDTGFPEYLPPREGEESFRVAVASAEAEGVHALVYMNQRLWGMTTRSWESEGAVRFAVKGADGQVKPEIYNTFTKAPCASMCLGTEYWRDKYAGLAESVAKDLGVAGIYMDQACSSLACYDAGHGHPPGGGTYWMGGFRRLAGSIRERCGGHAVTLAGEGVGESWLPYLDLMLSLQVSRERYAAPDGWEPVPFFQAVYHPYVIQYGNYSSLTMPPYDELWPPESAPQAPLELLDRKFSAQFRLEQARAFVWGQQPALANFQISHLDARPEEMAYVLSLARLRLEARKFLVQGTFLRPPVLDGGEELLDFSRLSIYAGQQGGLTTFQKRVPVVLASAWRAPEGSVGFVLANIADRAQAVELKLNRAGYGLPEQGWLWRLDGEGRKALGRLTPETTVLTVPLPACKACLIEVSAGDG